MSQELSWEKLRRSFSPKELGIQNTRNLQELKGIIGQERAVRALEFGLQIEGCGFNVYVSGMPGTGKMTSVQSFLKELADQKETPSDWCYVHNFDDSYNPKVIHLPAGRGLEFGKDMNKLIEHVTGELPKAFESEEYSNRRKEIIGSLKDKQDTLSKEINQTAREKGFQIRPTPIGLMFVPLRDGKPLEQEEFQNLTEDEQGQIEDRRSNLEDEVKSMLKKIRRVEAKVREKVSDLDRKIALHAVEGLIDDLIEKYKDFSKVVAHLEAVQDDIMENVDVFKASRDSDNQSVSSLGMMGSSQGEMAKKNLTNKYEVNVIVDNGKQKGAPVIVEYNPTYNNLIGRIEKEMRMGALMTDFTMLRAGSLLKANGGFLVIPVEELLTNYYSYEGLKRAIRASEVQIEELAERLGFMATKSLRPQPIPLDVKVILVGPPIYYYMLHAYDSDFSELFKVKADYDTRMKMNDENIRNFMNFIGTYCKKAELNHLDAKAAGLVMEHALRLAEDQEKISTKFGDLADLIREANFWARKDGSEMVSARHIRQTLDERIYRSNMIQEHIQEMIEQGTILIDTGSEVVGQVNGLSVLNLGNYEFGKPSRITATVGPGRGGIIDIEREVKLGGPIHSKGVLILSGYLNKQFAQGRPLTLSARLVFEQSYQGVEGDSASSAELYAILSALSDYPIKQGIAVTGSVNQQGEVQAIGGINEKIEGFFEVCKAKGLSGEQGVLIPESNVKNLMLREHVVNAVKENQFHVWPVKTIDEGIEILTGKSAGKLEEEDKFTAESVKERVRSRLRANEEVLKHLHDGDDRKPEKSEP